MKAHPQTRRPRIAHPIALAAAGLLGWLALSAVAAQPAPETLEATGLYADFSTKTVHPDNRPFAPQYPLYTDGADKKRWIYLPPGATIDASDPDHWVLPIGTRLWKEFAFGRRIETRFMERQADGAWVYAAYVWNADESAAVLAPIRGVRGVEVGDGRRHDVPGRYDCLSCHQGQPQQVLGFGALQLSPKRDPGALHASPLPEGALDLAALEAAGLLERLPAKWQGKAPEIPAASARERAALGYLHGNCGHCHNAAGPLAGLGLDLSVTLAAHDQAPARRTLLGVAAQKPVRSAPATLRVTPGSPEHSSLVERLSSRDPLAMMPPLGNRQIDQEAVALLAAWIREDLAQPSTNETVGHAP